MHTITDNESPQRQDAAVAPTATNAPGAGGAGHGLEAPHEGRVPIEDIDNLVLRIAGSDDGASIDDLAERSGGTRRPSGALMLAALDSRILAAASMSHREALSEPTPAGRAASAVIEYTLANLERRGTLPRRAA